MIMTTVTQEDEVRDDEETGLTTKFYKKDQQSQYKDIDKNLPPEPGRLMYQQHQKHLLVTLGLGAPRIQFTLQLSNFLQVQQLPQCKLFLNPRDILLQRS